MFNKVFFSATLVAMLALYPGAMVAASADPSARAILVPGSGTYSRKISTNNAQAQAFFDQGLRLAWDYFPRVHSILSEASRLDPPYAYWGMAHAMGPNPNSRYARMPDDRREKDLKPSKTRWIESIAPAP